MESGPLFLQSYHAPTVSRRRGPREGAGERTTPGVRSRSVPPRWPRRARSAIVHALSLARIALLAATDRVATSVRLEHELALLREELRIKDARMERVPPRRRPHYPAVERLAILELRAARGWSAAQTAERFFVTEATVASWMMRLDEDGPSALVRTPEPVNRFPDLVAHLVRRLKVLCPAMGTARIAAVLSRAGLHLGRTTVRRMLKRRPRRVAPAATVRSERRIRSSRPNHIWLVDLTTVPTLAGFWISWLPWSVPQRWPFCCWVAVGVDHFSRRIMGVRVFRGRPTAMAISAFLAGMIRAAGQAPRHLITDRGTRVHGAVVPARLPSRRDPAALRRDRQARQHRARRALHPHAQGRRRAALAGADPVAHRRAGAVALR